MTSISRFLKLKIGQSVFERRVQHNILYHYEIIVTQINVDGLEIIGLDISQHSKTIKLKTFYTEKELSKQGVLLDKHAPIPPIKTFALTQPKADLIKPLKIRVVKSAEKHIKIISGAGYAPAPAFPKEIILQTIIGTAFWYRNHFGDDFEVLPFSEHYYRVLNNPHCGFFFIHKDDCIVI